MTARRLKIVVAGRINSGKTTFIETISLIRVVSLINTPYKNYLRARESEERAWNLRRSALIRSGRGQVDIDDDLSLSLYRASPNLISISSILRGMHGFLVLVDSTDERSLIEGRVLLLYMMYYPIVPFIVVANKQDRPGALTVEQVRERMRLPEKIPLMPCIAKERDSVRDALLELIYRILPDT